MLQNDFLDGLVTKVYEFLENKKMESLQELERK